MPKGKCPYTGKLPLAKANAKAMSRYWRAQGERMAAYWCGCGAWHTGHTSRRPIPARKRKRRSERYNRGDD